MLAAAGAEFTMKDEAQPQGRAVPSVEDLPLLAEPGPPGTVRAALSLSEAADQRSGGGSAAWCVRLRVLALAAAVLGALYACYALPVVQYLVQSSDWLKARGVVGGVLLALFFWVVVVLCLPLDCACRVLAGYTFGFVPGCLIATAGMVGGCTLTFLAARAMGREWVQRRLSKGGRFLLALDRAIAKEGFKMLLMVMSSMVPVSFWSYGFGVLSVSLRDFVASSVLASLLYTLPICYVGSTARDLAAAMSGEGHVGRVQEVVLVVGLVMLLVSILGIGAYVKRALSEMEEEPDQAVVEGDIEMGPSASRTATGSGQSMSPKCK